jgi:hypothetical protein
MPKKKAETVEDRVLKLLIHRTQVLGVLGDTEYALGYVDGVTKAIQIVSGLEPIEKAILSAKIETREQ